MSKRSPEVEINSFSSKLFLLARQQKGQDHGNTPLHCCVARNELKEVIKLLREGADLTIKNEAGNSPYDFAASLTTYKEKNEAYINEDTDTIFQLLQQKKDTMEEISRAEARAKTVEAKYEASQRKISTLKTVVKTLLEDRQPPTQTSEPQGEAISNKKTPRRSTII